MIDTNILVYAYDPSESAKHQIAMRVVLELLREQRSVLSVQVLNEFYYTITRPRRPAALAHQEAAQVVRDMASASVVLSLTREVTLRALEAIPQYAFSFWDALIWAAAREHGIGVIYTEDFQHGREIEGVRFINPFTTTRE